MKVAVVQFNDALLATCDQIEGSTLEPDTAPRLAGAYEQELTSIHHNLAIYSLTTGMLREMGIGSESISLKGVRDWVSPLVPVRQIGQ